MRKSIVLLAFMLMAGMMPAMAAHYDFSASVSSGQTLFFKIEGNGVKVVSQYSQANATNYDDNNRPTGNLVIPNSISNDSASYVVVGIGTYAFRDCAGLSSVIIPNSVTSIGRQAFAGCTGLTAMTIPSSVTSIDGAFVGCANLLAVSLPNSISSMDGAFAGCSSLLSVNIPTSVSSIGFMTFYNCSSLDSISIPSSVNAIAANAFRGCTSLASIEVESGNLIFDSRDNCNAIVLTASDSLIQGCNTTVIPNTVKSIGDYAFSGCSGLTSVVVPDSVTQIGEGAFYNCSSLARVEVKGTVASLGKHVFEGCTRLEYISLPESLSLIYVNAFRYCSNIDSIMLHAVNPPVLLHEFNEDKLLLRSFRNSTFFVPCVSYQSYYDLWVSNNNLPYSIVFDSVSENTVFEPDSDTNWSLRLLANDSTMGIAEIVSTEGGFFNCVDTSAVIYAQANPHYHFGYWDNGSVLNPDTIALVSDTTITAFFAIDTHSVTLIGNDSIAVLTGAGNYSYGSEVTVSATMVSSDYRFDSWTVGDSIVSYNSIYSFVVISDIELTAVFVENMPNDVEVVDDEAVRIYPNPTSGNLTIEAEEFLFAELFDSKGNRLAVYRNANNIDISRFPGGRYLFGIRTRRSYVYRSIIISK